MGFIDWSTTGLQFFLVAVSFILKYSAQGVGHASVAAAGGVRLDRPARLPAGS